MKKVVIVILALISQSIQAQSVQFLLDSIKFEVIKRDIVLYQHEIQYSTTVDDELFDLCDFDRGTEVIQITTHVSCFSDPFKALHQEDFWEAYLYTINNLSSITYEEARVLFNQYDFQQFLLLSMLYKYPMFHPETKPVEFKVIKGKNKDEFVVNTKIFAIIPVKLNKYEKFSF